MATSKSKARTAAQQRARAQAKKAAARTAPPVRATPTMPTSSRTVRPTTGATAAIREADIQPGENETPAGPPTWFQVTTLILAVIGLGISAYETYAHFTGSHLLCCSGTCMPPLTAPPSSRRSRWCST